MSRICVKGLGKNTDEKVLRELFSSRGEVTDVKLARKADGTTRKFAFIGFRTDLQAQEAVRYFNNTFIGLSRIAVEMAKKLNDTALQEKKSQHAKKSTEKVKELKAKLAQVDEKITEKKDGNNNKKAADKVAEAPAVVGKNKAEFLELSRGKNRNMTWANDDLATHNPDQVHNASAPVPPVTSAVSKAKRVSTDSSAEEDGAAGSDSEDSAIDLSALIDKQKQQKSAITSVDGVETKTLESDGRSKTMSDLEYLRSKVGRFSKDSEQDSDDEEEGDDDVEDAADEEEEEEDARLYDRDHMDVSKEDGKGQGEAEEKAQTGEEDDEDNTDESRLFIKNIPFITTEDELRQLFASHGNITEVHIPLDKERKGKGIAYVHFMFPQDAVKAQQDLHGTSFQGRVLYINLAAKFKPQENHDLLADVRNSKLSKFQLKKEEERRKSLQKKESWNAAFVRSDAVLDSLADRYQVDKSSIMDTSLKGGDMAIRLAIGETQVIQENKEYLAKHGVDLNAMESINSSNKAVQRSTTTLLVKNLPPDTEVEELESMFARFGVLSNFVVPPSKTMALLDFVQSQDARNAFKNLAYRRYKNSPLYLEWAPLGTFSDGAKGNRQKASNKFDDKKEDNDAEKNEDVDNLDDFSTLFIKNLNFTTTDEALKDHLLRMGVEGLRTIHIQKKQIGSAMLSQGFGFAEFKSAAHAQYAVNKINNTVLDSHKLEVKPSDKRLTQAPTKLAKKQLQGSSSNPSNSCKLIVRNVAFQATKSEIRQLFTAFGSVKKVRIPKKMGGNHRGFAFVDFSTAQEAANAMTALKSTHLYGRHLVIEWAKEGEDDDEDSDTPELVNKTVVASRKRAQNDQRNLHITQQKAKRVKANIDEEGEEGTGDVKDYI